MVLSRPHIRYKSPYIPYLLNYLLIWVKTVTYFCEPYPARNYAGTIKESEVGERWILILAAKTITLARLITSV